MVAVLRVRSHANGSAIIYILVACVLFGYLLYTYSKSSSSSSIGNSAQNRIAYNEIQDIINSHRNAVDKILSQGYSVSDIDARCDNANYVNANCSSDSCRMYKPEGGGIRQGAGNCFWTKRASKASFAVAGSTTGVHSINSCMPTVIGNWFGTPTNYSDILLSMPTNKDFCSYFNKQIGVNPDTSTYSPTALAFTFQFTPSGLSTFNVNDGNSMARPGGHASYLAGKTQGCIKTSTTPFYWIAAVIYAK